MVTITLPDERQLEFDGAVTVLHVAQSIGAGLAKAALAGEVDGKAVDLSHEISSDARLKLFTSKNEEGLEVIRHSAAHLLAQAVKQLFPKVQVTIGPVIENGFYYDFSTPKPFQESDLEKIEARMQQIAKENLSVERFEMGRDEAVKFFREMGEEYKAKIIEDIPQDEVLSLYRQGDFVDLCRGPHVPNTGKLKAFKLTKLAGAYWRGDAKNEMLQRVYGTAWPDKKALEEYLHRLEEAERRDHRLTAKKLDLFHIQKEAPGMVFWHERGWTVYQLMQDYLRRTLNKHDYQEIRTPQIVDRSLWEASGHCAKFADGMFSTLSEDREYLVKPMNCPCHIQVFNQGMTSYRDLPLRMAEFGSCHRNEPSGTLHGLLRVRNFVQDDAHIFCTEDQIAQEVEAFIELLFEVYRDFGFTDILIKLATRPEQRVGSDEVWDKAEQALEQVLNDKALPWGLNPGEGAFYGPKLEFSLKDCLGRVWQCGTIQVDFSMPGRLGATYINAEGEKQTPVMLHRAILGTFERFMGILLEECAGNLPFWLAPVQAVVLNITESQGQYAAELHEYLKNQGVRAKIDLRNEKIGLKIREHSMMRVPYLLVVGDKEREAKTVSVRTQQGEDRGSLSWSELRDVFKSEFLPEVMKFIGGISDFSE